MSDWRLTNQEKYLSGKRLLKKQFVPTERNDHEHCRFCWERFDKVNHPDAYCTEDEYYWICEQCYEDFKEQFQWQTESGSLSRK